MHPSSGPTACHAQVVKHFAMRPLPGVRLTLITRDMHTPYRCVHQRHWFASLLPLPLTMVPPSTHATCSGMLPGFVSGFYSFDDCHIDLARLSTWAGARLVHAEATGIDIKVRILVAS